MIVEPLKEEAQPLEIKNENCYQFYFKQNPMSINKNGESGLIIEGLQVPQKKLSHKGAEEERENREEGSGFFIFTPLFKGARGDFIQYNPSPLLRQAQDDRERLGEGGRLKIIPPVRAICLPNAESGF